jgi:hypothetical protein
MPSVFKANSVSKWHCFANAFALWPPRLYMISPHRSAPGPLLLPLLAVLLLPLVLSQSCVSLGGTSCSTCTTAGCSWCPISGLCVPRTQTITHGCRFRMNSPSSCPSKYCSTTPQYGTCGICTSDYFCYWCATSGTCGSWNQCSSHRVIGYPFDCWAAAPPPPPPAAPPAAPPPPAALPPPPPAAPPPPPPPVLPPADAINSQLPAYSPCVSGTPPTSCTAEQLRLQAMPDMCPAAPPNGPAYFAPFGIDSVSKCAIMPSRSVFGSDASCSAVPVPSSCSASSRHWAALGTITSCSPQSPCGMCSSSVPVWAPYGRDTSGCPIVWCPQGCPFVWASPSLVPSPPAPAPPPPPPNPSPAVPSSCAAGLFATASSAGSTTCIPCPAGAYCPSGSHAPTPCAAGTASNYTGAASPAVTPQPQPATPPPPPIAHACDGFAGLCSLSPGIVLPRRQQRRLPLQGATSPRPNDSQPPAAIHCLWPRHAALLLTLQLLRRLAPSPLLPAPALLPIACCAPQATTAPL